MPQKQKLSPDEKIAIVQQYINGEISQKEASQRAGVSYRLITEWTIQYKVRGSEAFNTNGEYTVYPAEVKLAVVKKFLAGEGTAAEICLKYNIHSLKLLYRWVRVYNAHGDSGFINDSGGGSHMGQGRETTLEERVLIALECISSGKDYASIASKYNVSYQQARNWTLQYEEQGEAGLEDRRGKRKKDQTPRSEGIRTLTDRERAVEARSVHGKDGA